MESSERKSISKSKIKRNTLNIATWNVRTLVDVGRTEDVIKDMEDLGIDGGGEATLLRTE